MIRRLAAWVDSRLGTGSLTRRALKKIFPDHWSFLLGEIALYAFVVLVLTGLYLTFFFVAGTREVVYDGAYVPLRGVRMSQAYASTLDISFEVRAGIVMRQMHHWAALVFLGALLVHGARVFFTGAYRRPRELNWIIGVALAVLAMGNGFTGYSLPDDLLSGTGLRIAYSIVLSIPLLGVWAAFLFFGGEFPAEVVIERLYVLHILVIPVVIGGLLAAHLALVWRQQHTQFAGPGRTERNIEGLPLWPGFALRSAGLFSLTAAVLAGLGGLVQINPIWLYGPFRADAVSAGSQPDWYLGWLEGAVRLFPSWHVEAFGYEIPSVFFPGVLLPGLTFGAVFAWPFLEARVRGDREEHHLLDTPRDAPVRTGIGVGLVTLYVLLFVAGGNDVLANTFRLSVEAMTWVLRVAVLALPPAAGYVAYRACRDLDRGPITPRRGGHRVRITRLPGGGFATAADDPADHSPSEM